MKILLVNKYHYVRGGSETYYFGLAELLKKAGHEVIFFAMNDEKNLPCEQSKYFIDNVEFNGALSPLQKIKAAFKMVYSFEAKRKIGQLMDDEKPDIVHINLFHRVHTASIVDAAKKRNIPVVFTMHDLNPICPNHTMLDHGNICEDCLHGNYLCCAKKVCFKDSRAKCLMAAIESAYNKITNLYKKMDVIITPSEFYRQLLIRSKLTDKQIVHMKNFLPSQTEYRVSGSRGNYVLYYGRLSYEKGILTLVRAMAGIDLKLIVAGIGPEEERIRKEIRERHLDNKFELVGFQSGEQLWAFVKNAACVVVPSEWYEASGYTACEAQAMGKPVVVTDAGGLPENIVDGKSGVICPMKDENALANAIRCVLELSDEQYLKMSENAVTNAKKLFLAEDYVQKLGEIYKQLRINKNV